jgi:hypothetical protein
MTFLNCWGTQRTVCLRVVSCSSKMFLFISEGKGKTLPESVCGREVLAPLVLNLSSRWLWLGSFTLRPLYPHRTCPRYPWNRRLCWSKIQCGRYGKRSSSLPLPVIEARFLDCRHCADWTAGPSSRRPWTRHECSVLFMQQKRFSRTTIVL